MEVMDGYCWSMVIKILKKEIALFPFSLEEENLPFFFIIFPPTT